MYRLLCWYRCMLEPTIEELLGLSDCLRVELVGRLLLRIGVGRVGILLLLRRRRVRCAV